MAPVMSRTSASRAVAISAPSIVPEPSASTRLDHLQRRDLGLVEHEVHVTPAVRDLDARVLVDREVAERMRPAAGTTASASSRASSRRLMPPAPRASPAAAPRRARTSGWKRGLRALRAPQCRDRLGPLAGAGRDRAEVVGEQRIGALQRVGGAGLGQRGVAVARPEERPAEGVVRVHRRALAHARCGRAATASARSPWSASNSASSRSALPPAARNRFCSALTRA